MGHANVFGGLRRTGSGNSKNEMRGSLTPLRSGRDDGFCGDWEVRIGNDKSGRAFKATLAHVADGHLGDAGVGGLHAGEDDGLGHVFGVHHVGVADVVFGAAFAEGEFGFGASGADGSDVDVVGAEFGVEGLGEAYLGKF